MCEVGVCALRLVRHFPVRYIEPACLKPSSFPRRREA
ncbi:MAG: hypothetical protein V7642_882, partial [Burkholderiales bacterium]